MKCADCIYRKKSRYCDFVSIYVDDDIKEYTLLDPQEAAIEVEVSDDTGLEIKLRVADDFGCVNFVKRTINKITKNST